MLDRVDAAVDAECFFAVPIGTMLVSTLKDEGATSAFIDRTLAEIRASAQTYVRTAIREDNLNLDIIDDELLSSMVVNARGKAFMDYMFLDDEDGEE